MQMNIAKRSREKAGVIRLRGMTLLELMVAMAIVGILAAIAYPSYMQFITRTKRSVAKSALLKVADREEQFFADNKRYTSDLTQLGYGANGFMVDAKGAEVAAGDGHRIYAISLTNTSATTYTANAVPQLQQAANDGQCQTLTLTHKGQKGQTGPGGNCW